MHCLCVERRNKGVGHKKMKRINIENEAQFTSAHVPVKVGSNRPQRQAILLGSVVSPEDEKLQRLLSQNGDSRFPKGFYNFNQSDFHNFIISSSPLDPSQFFSPIKDKESFFRHFCCHFVSMALHQRSSNVFQSKNLAQECLTTK
jgi:hypothetical protein